MKLLSDIDAGFFDGALDTRVAEQNEKTADPRARYERCEADEGHLILRVWRGIDPAGDLYFRAAIGGDSDGISLTGDIARDPSAERDSARFAARLIARLTLMLMLGAIAWGIAVGVTFIAGRGDWLLPLAAPIFVSPWSPVWGFAAA